MCPNMIHTLTLTGICKVVYNKSFGALAVLRYFSLYIQIKVYNKLLFLEGNVFVIFFLYLFFRESCVCSLSVQFNLPKVYYKLLINTTANIIYIVISLHQSIYQILLKPHTPLYVCIIMEKLRLHLAMKSFKFSHSSLLRVPTIKNSMECP